MKIVKILTRYLKGFRFVFFISLFAAVLVQIFAVFEPLIIKVAIDTLFMGEPIDSTVMEYFVVVLGGISFLKEHLWIISLVYLSVVALKSFFQFVYRYFSSVIAQGIAENIRISIYDKVQRIPFLVHGKFQTGDLIQRCTSDIEDISNFFGSQLIDTICTTTLIVFILVSLFLLNAWLAIIAMCFFVAIILNSLIFYQKFEKAYTEVEKTESRFFVNIQEYLTGIRVVKAFGMQNLEAEKFDKTQKDFLKNDYKTTKMFGVFWTIGDILSYSNLACTVVVGFFMLIQGSVTAGTLIAFVSYLYKINWPIRGFARIISRMSKIVVSQRRLQEVLDTESEILEEPKSLENHAPKIDKIDGKIEFSNVSLQYEGSEKNVFENISFTIDAGKTLAIMGATGSGKTSLVQLLPRLYEYSSGSIKIDGVELKALDKNFVRKNIGLILQETFLFSKSIRENIKLASDSFTDEQMYAACKTACIYDDIMKFEYGFDTIVGEKGVLLSGGQRQRISIARTLINNYPIVIFDDSLSAVDTETDLSIRQALEEKKDKATRIIISHRISTCKNADHIIFLADGKIVQEGIHEDLIRQDGPYKRIYEIQNDDFIYNKLINESAG
ncbi:MAG: ABC transporter ATP-binding protein [Spirochaetaceae bacterium]|nr:ABC transporter ATP-binding protein [Spirochaetaceae bacterium]